MAWSEHFYKLFTNQCSTVAANIDDFCPPKNNARIPQHLAPKPRIHTMENEKNGLDGSVIELENYVWAMNAWNIEWDYLIYVCRMVRYPHIVHKSGNVYHCDNYRGISRINYLRKVLKRIILNRIAPFAVASRIIPDYQYGFLKDRSTTDGILTCRPSYSEFL